MESSVVGFTDTAWELPVYVAYGLTDRLENLAALRQSVSHDVPAMPHSRPQVDLDCHSGGGRSSLQAIYLAPQQLVLARIHGDGSEPGEVLINGAHVSGIDVGTGKVRSVRWDQSLRRYERILGPMHSRVSEREVDGRREQYTKRRLR
jgi:hypothetical protein